MLVMAAQGHAGLIIKDGPGSYKKLCGSMSMWIRTEFGGFTPLIHERRRSWMRTERVVRTSSRRRCRPRKIERGAGAGPNTLKSWDCGALWAKALATPSTCGSFGPETTIAASRPKGGQLPAFRCSASARIKASRWPLFRAAMTG